MKRPFLMLSAFALLGAAITPAFAGNSSVEATLEGYGDTSMFYQALVTTGVINELNESTHYTIFAPTNAAFIAIRPQTYPCFYAEQCRPQIAAMLRNHIVVGRHDLADLTTYGRGIQSGGVRRVHVEEPFVGQYTAEGQDILSKADVGGNVIYRINGVITTPQELAQFQTVNMIVSPAADTITTEKTVTQKTYHTPAVIVPAPGPYPGGAMPTSPNDMDDNRTETTTVIHHYTVEQ